MTRHRLLTSHDIVLKNKELAQKNEDKVKQKQEREEKREEKRRLELQQNESTINETTVIHINSKLINNFVLLNVSSLLTLNK